VESVLLLNPYPTKTKIYRFLGSWNEIRYIRKKSSDYKMDKVNKITFDGEWITLQFEGLSNQRKVSISAFHIIDVEWNRNFHIGLFILGCISVIFGIMYSRITIPAFMIIFAIFLILIGAILIFGTFMLASPGYNIITEKNTFQIGKLALGDNLETFLSQITKAKESVRL
jgi:hypothetical protein